jgi:hypothetical protein
MANKKKTCPETMKKYKAGTDIPAQSAFKPEYCDMLINMGKEGKSIAQFCSRIERGENAVRAWRKAYPVFEDAYQTFLIHSKAYWEALGNEYITTVKGFGGSGVQFDTALYKYITGGRFNHSHQKDIDLPALREGSLHDKLLVVLDAASKGDITPNQATALTSIIRDGIDIEIHSEMKQQMIELKKRVDDLGQQKILPKVAEEPEYTINE